MHQSEVIYFNRSQIEELYRLAGLPVPVRQKTISVRSHGGQKEIGGPNCKSINVIDENNSHSLFLDCGARPYNDELGDEVKEKFIPNFDGVDWNTVDGLVISHGHQDHVSGIPHLIHMRGIRENPFPIYCSEIAKIVIERVLFYAIQKRRISEEEANTVEFRPLKTEQKIGPFFVFSFPICHTIQESRALVVSAAGKNICYLTDFRFQMSGQIEWNKTVNTLQTIGQMGIDLLLIDATGGEDQKQNVTSLISTSTEFQKIIKKRDFAGRRIIIANFSVSGEENSLFASIANEIGRRRVETSGGPNSAMTYFCRQFGVFREDFQKRFSENNAVIFVTGSQAEPDATLTKASHKDSDNIKLLPDDVVVIPTRVIPGNRLAVNGMLDRLSKIVYKIIVAGISEEDARKFGKIGESKKNNFGSDQTSKDEAEEEENYNNANWRVESCPRLHASGHADFSELAEAVRLVSPGVVSAIHAHATRRHRFERNLRRRLTVTTNGLPVDGTITI